MTGRVLPNWSDSFFLRRSLTPSLSIASMKRCVNCREWIDGIKERLQICEPGSPAAKAFLLDYFFLPSPNNEMKSQTIEKQSQIEHIEIRERPCSVEFDRVSVIDRLSLSLSLSLLTSMKRNYTFGADRGFMPAGIDAEPIVVDPPPSSSAFRCKSVAPRYRSRRPFGWWNENNAPYRAIAGQSNMMEKDSHRFVAQDGPDSAFYRVFFFYILLFYLPSFVSQLHCDSGGSPTH